MGKGVFSSFCGQSGGLYPKTNCNPKAGMLYLIHLEALRPIQRKGRDPIMNKKPIIGITGNFMAKAGPRRQLWHWRRLYKIHSDGGRLPCYSLSDQ